MKIFLTSKVDIQVLRNVFKQVIRQELLRLAPNNNLTEWGAFLDWNHDFISSPCAATRYI